MALLTKDGGLISVRAAEHLRMHGVRERSCTLTAGPLSIDYHEHLCTHVSHLAEPIELSRMEFKLLELLMRNAGKPVARDVILATLWNLQHDPATNRVEVLVNQLRRRFSEAQFGDDLIVTIRGWGYRFETAVRSAGAS
jgi:two-component system response regulator RegX3